MTPIARRVKRGHTSPFAPVVPSLVAAVGYASAASGWVVAGRALPGGRWLAVHLFTLGVLTNVIPAFTTHFATTLTRAPNPVVRHRWVLVLNAGILAVLVGLPTASRAAVGAGATVVTSVVVWSWWRLWRMRRAAVGARFVWVVRMYERAHGAFVLGAVLGALMGTGMVAGSWYEPARIAHLHVNLLGWAGITLLATLVFFGPTVARTRIVPGADDRAAGDLGQAATALIVAVLAMLATGVDGSMGTVLRLVAAGCLAAYATTTSRVCRDVRVAAQGARATYGRVAVIAVCLWFPIVVWLDVLVVAAGEWQYLDALGLAVIAGVLLQAVMLAIAHVAPMVRTASRTGRDVVLSRIDRFATGRVLVHNLGVVLVVVAAATRSPVGAWVARVGWAGVGISVATLLAAVVSPLPSVTPVVTSARE